ncbi:CheR family methyltransferase [Flavobacterium ustbae]|uniref:CheR family methyltransferase n=1 Tax=Flavobacterium ustbae TaxID=2488790 RepID=UPI000F7927FB|nr:CheR family methyltransferase [Flavobacterium ustbae]
MNSQIKEEQIAKRFPIVGIGTSVQDIDILKTVIGTIPEDSGMAFLIIEHLADQQHDNLASILEPLAKIPVIEIVSVLDLAPNHIYVIPHSNFLTLENSVLTLKPFTRSHKTNSCFDLFYEAISKKFDSYAVGLHLTWSLFDGASGLKKIKEAGGATVSATSKAGFSVSKGSAEFIDYLATPEKAIDTLLHIKKSYIANHAYQETETAEDETIFKSIINLLVLKTGTNFHHYKPQTIRRRIAKRMVITKQETAEKYHDFLKQNENEQDLLFNDILISVTYFFRDSSFFDSLSNIVFPSLIENLVDNQLRIWSAGCSTGEEVYSLAIALDEYLQKIKRNDISIKFFASDLSEKCIAKARSGIYTIQDLKNLSEERIANYFTKRENGYHINKAIRDNCVFAVHDLSQDFPFSKIDFISCRNVLIYFNADLQQRVLSSFHYALRDKGFLFLGKSESSHTAQNLFAAVESKEKIYIRQNNGSRILANFMLPKERSNRNKVADTEIAENIKDFKKITEEILVEKYSPAAVLIKEDFEIVYFHGDTSPYLQPSTGKPSFTITNMVHEEIRFSLKNAILKVRNDKKNFESAPIAATAQSFLTSFEVVYLPNHKELLLIVFCKKTLNENLGEKTRNIKNDFHHLNDEQQIYFEELQTTNEELLRRTEELQFLNEQLESSSEELRSNNQELSCTNDELRDRRNELFSMRNFYESIVKTIKEPLLIIDKNFVVHSSNPAFYNYFKTKEEDTEGFSIFEIGNSTWNTAEFKDLVLKKIGRNETVENVKIQFHLNSGRKKTMLVTAAAIENSAPEGMLLIAFEDITDTEETREYLQAKNEELRSYSSQLESFTIAASHNLLDPVRKIYMFGKKIIDSEASITESGRNQLHRLLNTAANLNKLMEDLINYSKINFAEKKFKKTDLNLLLKKALHDLKNVIKEKNAVITADDLLPMSIIPQQMLLLFTHLVENSLRYSKKESVPEIKISMYIVDNDELEGYNYDADCDYIKLSVSDNGIGFGKDFETLIFDPFYKLQSDEQHYSTGLGLTLVQKIVSNHRGFIKASSTMGEGTSIYIYLPFEVSFAGRCYSPN